MTTPLHELDQRFTDVICTGSNAGIYAKIFQIEDVLQAGAKLRRLEQSLAPLVKGGITISDQDVQQLVTSYAEHYPSLSKGKESLTAWSVKRLLEHSPGLHAEELQHLAQDLETITAAVRETARLRAANPLPGASAGESGCAWVSREEQKQGHARW